MPPRWPRQPDRKDPAYRKLADRMNLAVHIAIFAATNSGVWFFRLVQQADWGWTIWVSGIWFGALVAHLLYVVAIADYSEASATDSTSSASQQ